MRLIRSALSVAGAVIAGVTVLAVPADAQTFQLSPGQQECVSIQVTAVAGDQLYTQINYQGSASAPVHWTRWHDIVDGNDGFANASLTEQSVLDRTAQNFSEQFGETDDGPGAAQLDVWFCAENRGGTAVSATLDITTSQRAAPTWILTRTGNISWWAHGALQPGQQACTGAGARHATIEAYIGLRLAKVTITNSRTTREAITDQFAQLSLDSTQPGGFPEGMTGCVQNLDTAQLNFNLYFYWS